MYHPMWDLKTKVRSSASTVLVLNHKAISLAPIQAFLSRNRTNIYGAFFSFGAEGISPDNVCSLTLNIVDTVSLHLLTCLC